MRRPKKEPTTNTNVPTMSPEARENQVINAAMNLAEQQILEGTASSQVITYFLKLGSSKERLEKEKLQEENKLLRAKTEALASAARVEELYTNALNAMRSYSGNTDNEEAEEDIS
jgi:hypothetical protein